MHPNTFILLWTLTFHSPINSCCIIFISCPTFILIYTITKIKWLVNSVSCWLWGFYLFTAYFKVFFFRLFVFLHFWFLLFICLVVFSKHVRPYLCPSEPGSKGLWRSKTANSHSCNTCALMSNLQCYFGLHEWHVYFFYFYCFWNDYRKLYIWLNVNLCITKEYIFVYTEVQCILR